MGIEAVQSVCNGEARPRGAQWKDESDGKNFMSNLKAPFPYFGGKSMVADVVWRGLGDVKHYIEPFFGSGAVLLARPNYNEAKHMETVNDACGFVANAWRSIQFQPDETAKWCDWPVNHADLNARRKEILKNEKRLLENLVSDPLWCDPIQAGYWIWAASCWIGSGLTRPDARPHLTDAGRGVQRPHISTSGHGVHGIGKQGIYTDAGRGGKRPHITNAGTGVHKIGKQGIYGWFDDLSKRLRRVRVVCGDWRRVCGGNWQDNVGTVGIFFDPPYADDKRGTVYSTDSFSVAHDVRDWAIKRGDRPSYRIVIAGYDEHNELEAHGWRKHAWKAHGGYSNAAQDGSTANGKDNAKRETLWFSPHCKDNEAGTIPMFGGEQ